MKEKEGVEQIVAILKGFRANPPAAVAGEVEMDAMERVEKFIREIV